MPGGKQIIQTVDGFEFPLRIHNGLPYMDLRPFTNKEWDSLTHVILTSDATWNPSVLDSDHFGNEEGDQLSTLENVGHEIMVNWCRTQCDMKQCHNIMNSTNY